MEKQPFTPKQKKLAWWALVTPAAVTVRSQSPPQAPVREYAANARCHVQKSASDVDNEYCRIVFSSNYIPGAAQQVSLLDPTPPHTPRKWYACFP